MCRQCGGRRELLDERGHEKSLSILNAFRQPDLGERTSNEIAGSCKAPVEHRPGAPGDSNVPRLDHLERDHRGMDQVAQFMSKESEPFVVASGFSLHVEPASFAPVLSDSARDRIVKASVQHTKVIRADA